MDERGRKFRQWLFDRYEEWHDEIKGNKNWTQFAAYLGIDKTVIEKWRNKKKPRLPYNDHVVRLSNKYKTMEVYEILGWEKPKCF